MNFIETLATIEEPCKLKKLWIPNNLTEKSSNGGERRLAEREREIGGVIFVVVF